MTPDARSARARLERAEMELRNAQNAVSSMEARCPHEWGDAVYDPVHHKGYRVEGDPPGTMGVDRMLPFHVPPRTDRRWRRECRVCGKVEYTARTDEHVSETPRF